MTRELHHLVVVSVVDDYNNTKTLRSNPRKRLNQFVQKSCVFSALNLRFEPTEISRRASRAYSLHRPYGSNLKK
jgi:hypothetical protein